MTSVDSEIINNRFQIGPKVGNGSFGEVYLAIDLQTNEECAIKIEINSEIQSQLQHEARVLKIMQGTEGFPNVIWNGQDSKNREILAMELLSFNLEGLLQFQQDKRMTLKTVLMMADQMLKRIESLHQKFFLYRDIKPENFLIGKGKQIGQIYLIDFGLVKRFREIKTGKHIPYRDNKGLIGTAKFVSVNTHIGVEQSRRDDLESLAYVWVYLLKGKLPWSGIIGETKEEKYEKMKQLKISTAVEYLCEGLPDLFKDYINYCRQLKFEEQPDYFYLKSMVKEYFFKLEYQWDYLYDWMLVQNEQPVLNNKSEYQMLIPNKCVSEDDIRGRKGSTTYESLKDNQKEEIQLKLNEISTKHQSESSGMKSPTLGFNTQKSQKGLSNSRQNINQELEGLKNIKQQLFSDKEEINFKIVTPKSQNTKLNISKLKLNPNFFENIFKSEN